jgi:hypothetical protein
MGFELRSDFETGNGQLVRVAGDEVHFCAEAKRGSAVLWWHFEVRGVGGQQLHFVLDNAAACLGGAPSLAPARPVINFGAKDWHRLPPGVVDEQAGTWRFAAFFPSEVQQARLAFCYPYGLQAAERVIAGWRKVGAGVEVVSRSPGGREVPMLVWGPAGEGGRELVVITARQHAGETPGSFVLEGLIEAFLAPGRCGQWLRRRGLLVVFPVMDVDGVAEGSYGKNQAPVDINRDWAGHSYWPQVRAARQVIAELAQRHRYAFFLDLHAPCAHEHAFVYKIAEELLPAAARRGQERLIELLDQRPCRWFDFHAADCYTGERHAGIAALAQAKEHGCGVACLETPYHVTREGRVGTPLRYRQHGHAVAAALVQVVEESRGWRV